MIKNSMCFENTFFLLQKKKAMSIVSLPFINKQNLIFYISCQKEEIKLFHKT
jgi:hypothetical protein